MLSRDSPYGADMHHSKLASASPSSPTLNCSSNKLGPTCLLVFILLAIFADEPNRPACPPPLARIIAALVLLDEPLRARQAVAGECKSESARPKFARETDQLPTLLQLPLQAHLQLKLPHQVFGLLFRGGELILQLPAAKSLALGLW